MGKRAYAEGYYTIARGAGSHADGSCNFSHPTFIYSSGVGSSEDPENPTNEAVVLTRLNAEVTYVGRTSRGEVDIKIPRMAIPIS